MRQLSHMSTHCDCINEFVVCFFFAVVHVCSGDSNGILQTLAQAIIKNTHANEISIRIALQQMSRIV